jgi:hypothetical protein
VSPIRLAGFSSTYNGVPDQTIVLNVTRPASIKAGLVVLEQTQIGGFDLSLFWTRHTFVEIFWVRLFVGDLFSR